MRKPTEILKFPDNCALRAERRPPESTCLECHNPQHSDAFVYAEKIRLVQHEAGPVSAR